MATTALDHPWRGPFRQTVTREAETARPCTKCGETKPLDCFRRAQGRWHERTCRDCRNAHERATRRRDPASRRLRLAADNARRNRARRAARLAAGLQPAPRRWWTTARAMAETGLDDSSLRRLARTGEVEAGRDEDGRRWRISPDSLRPWLAGAGAEEAA